MTTTSTEAPARLTREEDAYAHLASFQAGDLVDVAGPLFYQPGTVKLPQQHAATMEGAWLIVDGCGVQTVVSVAALLSGKRTITLQAAALELRTRYFDEVGYAAQNGQG